jgi:hypothetical protein
MVRLKNKNSRRVCILMTDLAREIHEQGFVHYLIVTNEIRLYIIPLLINSIKKKTYIEVHLEPY